MIPIKNKTGILLLLLFILFLLVMVLFVSENYESSFKIYICKDDIQEELSLWKNEDDYYVFLPACVEMENVFFRFSTDTEVAVNGIIVSQGQSCTQFAYDVMYEMEIDLNGRKRRSQIMFVQSSEIATIFLNTASGNMEYIHAKKENKESGYARIYDANGSLNSKIDELQIEGRGNATWTYHDKKPYLLELNQEVDLLGMGKAKKWILLANAADHSHLRNKLVYDFAREIGLPYSPESQWVNLYLNGEYAGLYLLSEKNEIHTERVNILSNDSFLMSIELRKRMDTQGISYIETDCSQSLRIHYPTVLTQDVLTKLKHQWQSVENAIISENGLDPVSGKYFWELADLDSWVRHYLIDELFGNMDGFKASRYFYLDGSSNQKIYAGPVWDYDKAMGNDTDIYWSVTNPRVNIMYRYAYDAKSAHLWAQKLYEQEWFYDVLIQTFEDQMLPALEMFMNGRLEYASNLIRQSAIMDSIRWGWADVESFDQAVAKVDTYLYEHLEYIKEIWASDADYCQVSFLKSGCDQFYTVARGNFIAQLPMVADRENQFFTGWYYSDTNEPFDISKPITEDIQLYAKWEDKPGVRIKQIVKLAPLGVITVMGVALLVTDLRKQRRA